MRLSLLPQMAVNSFGAFGNGNCLLSGQEPADNLLNEQA